MRYSSTVPVHLVQHPVAHDALLFLRDKSTNTSHFRRLTHRMSLVLAMEATRTLPLSTRRVETPLESADGLVLDTDIVVVPVLRAGLGMVEAVLELISHARVGHIGLQRDEETAVASQYYSKLPRDLSNSMALVVDPMLATGGSAVAAIDFIKRRGGLSIKLMAIVSAPEGIAKVHEAHPDVPIYVAAVDEGLNDKAYIVPGLGDAGDRLYGTR